MKFAADKLTPTPAMFPEYTFILIVQKLLIGITLRDQKNEPTEHKAALADPLEILVSRILQHRCIS